MNWSQAAKQVTSEMGAGGKYFKVKAGESRTVTFLGCPVVNEREFPGSSPVKRISCNVLEEGGNQAQIFEFGNSIFKAINKVIEKRGQEVWFEIEREGEGMSTRWTATLMGPLTPEDKKLAASLELHELSDDKPVDTPVNAPANAQDIDF